MAVETATERAIFFNTDDFGKAATYTPDGGSATTVNGILDNPYLEAEAGGSVPVASRQPVFICASSTVPNAAEGDSIVIDTVSYIVRVVDVEESTDITNLILEKV